uniref:Cadherin domain-containing protein n=1 Tax=Oryctolagus cuniculus TaxID=9986 RepID=G1U2M3_RABIT
NLISNSEIHLEILESVSAGARMPLDPATDPDINTNSIKDYQISPNPYFSLMVRVNSDGGKYPELSLERLLDREEQRSHRLTLTAWDGGDPPRSATARVEILVRDANDNPPVFSKDEYRISVRESLPPGSSVLRVAATDQDEGPHAEIKYYVSSAAQSARDTFSLDERTGEIKNNRSLDFEEVERYTLEVEAKDGGGLSAHCKVVIEILDENDNSPEITITSLSDQILEDSPPGTVAALFKTRDRDFGKNGLVTCNIEGDLPFKIYSSSTNFYKENSPICWFTPQMPTVVVVGLHRSRKAGAQSRSLIGWQEPNHLSLHCCFLGSALAKNWSQDLIWLVWCSIIQWKSISN